MRTLKELAEEAYRVQDACNLAGVLRGATRAHDDLRKLAEQENKEWDWCDKHPIMQLWSDKIAQLAGTQFADVSHFYEIYNEINKLRCDL